MSAETLRRAAALMRGRAEAATPGPWSPQGDKIRATSEGALIPDNILVAYASAHYQRLGMTKTGRGTPVPDHAPDVQHVASWHPAVALAVADWLDNAAEDHDLLSADGELGPFHDTMMRRFTHEKALAVARAYLGEAETDR